MKSFFYLMEAIQKVCEEGDTATAATSAPGTTEDNIAALPAHIGKKPVRPAKKKLEVQEDDVDQNPEEDLRELHNELKVSLDLFFEHGDLKRAYALYRHWVKFWGNVESNDKDKSNVAVTFEHRDRDIQKLYSNLIQDYGSDRGSLEMMIEDLRQGRTPSMFEGFKDYEFLYGNRSVTKYHGYEIVFEFYLDTSENIYLTVEVMDADVADALEADAAGAKRVGNVFYPNSKYILPFFKAIKNAIHDVEDDHEEKQEYA